MLLQWLLSIVLVAALSAAFSLPVFAQNNYIERARQMQGPQARPNIDPLVKQVVNAELATIIRGILGEMAERDYPDLPRPVLEDTLKRMSQQVRTDREASRIIENAVRECESVVDYHFTLRPHKVNNEWIRDQVVQILNKALDSPSMRSALRALAARTLQSVLMELKGQRLYTGQVGE